MTRYSIRQDGEGYTIIDHKPGEAPHPDDRPSLTVIPHPLHDWQDDKNNRELEPERRIHEIKEGLRYLEAMGMSKEADEIWFEFYYGARK